MSAPIIGDALLLALAAQYRATLNAVRVFEDEEMCWSGAMSTYCKDRSDDHYARSVAILEAIAALKADGPAGAMVQLEALHRSLESGEYDDERRRDHESKLRESIICSVYSVLAGMTRHTAAEGIRVLPAYRDTHRADLGALIAEWRAMFDAEEMSYAEKPGARRRHAA